MLVSTSLLRVVSISKGNAIGIFLSITLESQSSNTIFVRNSHEKAAVYAKKDAATKQVPIILFLSSCKRMRSCDQRVFSELRPLIKASAACLKVNTILILEATG